MVSGNWLNNDGLPLFFGTSKAQVDPAGEFKSYGESREFEILLNLGTGGTTTFGGVTSGPIITATASVISNTALFPLQTTALGSSTQFISFEEVTIETLVGMVANGATALNVGLAVISPGSPSTIVAATPNAGTQILNGILNATFTTAGQRSTLVQGGTGVGSWIGTVPLVTNAIVPLPQSALFTAQSVGGTGYTSGLLKVRVKYSVFGTIQF